MRRILYDEYMFDAQKKTSEFLSPEDLVLIDTNIARILGNERSIAGISNDANVVISKSFMSKYCIHIGGKNIRSESGFTQLGGEAVINIDPDSVSCYYKKIQKKEEGTGGYDIVQILNNFRPLSDGEIKKDVPMYSHERLSIETLNIIDKTNHILLTTQNNNGSLDTWNYLVLAAKIVDLQEGWKQRDAKEVLDEIIDNVPPVIITTSKDAGAIKTPPSKFELFLLSKLKNFSPHWNNANLYTGSLGVMESMLCMRDQIRTQRFLQSIATSVKRLEEKGVDPIYMCDAGCGSVPILAIYACLCSSRVQCTCLELNRDSAKVAEEIVKSFGLSDRITVKQADATKYQHDRSIDLLVSETMHSGLTTEPIAQIFDNLSQQVSHESEIIPKKVTVKARLIKPIDFFGSGDRIVKIYSEKYLHHFVDGTFPTKFTLDTSCPSIDINFDLTAEDDGEYLIVLISDVDTGSDILNEYDSLITMPQSLTDADGMLRTFKLNKGEAVHISYKAGSNVREINARTTNS